MGRAPHIHPASRGSDPVRFGAGAPASLVVCSAAGRCGARETAPARPSATGAGTPPDLALPLLPLVVPTPHREFKGPVTALAGLEGYLLLASGNRIETCALSRWGHGKGRAGEGQGRQGAVLLIVFRCASPPPMVLLFVSSLPQPQQHLINLHKPLYFAPLQHHYNQYRRGRHHQHPHLLEGAALG